MRVLRDIRNDKTEKRNPWPQRANRLMTGLVVSVTQAPCEQVPGILLGSRCWGGGTQRKVQVGGAVLTPGVWGSVRGPNFPGAYTCLLDPGSGFVGSGGPTLCPDVLKWVLEQPAGRPRGRGCPARSFQPLGLGVTAASASTPLPLPSVFPAARGPLLA